MPTSDPWNSFEITKLLVAVLTPLSVATLGWMISRNLKRLDLAQWQNQKLLEKRLAIYDAVAPKLNLLLCFYTWVGYWKSLSPQAVVEAKRELDQSFHVYRHLFADTVFKAYQDFINALFETYTAAGHDARIRSLIRSMDGDRRDGPFAWDPDWDSRFSSADKVESKARVRLLYQALMNELTRSFGVVHADAGQKIPPPTLRDAQPGQP